MSSPVAGRIGEFFDVITSQMVVVPGANASDASSISHESVIGIPQREEFGSLGVEPAEHDGEIVSLAPRVAEEDAVELRTKFLAQSLRILALLLVHVDLGVVDHLLALLLDDFRNSRM